MSFAALLTIVDYMPVQATREALRALNTAYVRTYEVDVPIC